MVSNNWFRNLGCKLVFVIKILLVLIACVLPSFYSSAVAQQIVTDGKTNTTLNTAGTTTDVSTTSVVSGNAFNSFSKFNVDAGNTVNLKVPDNASNLINLIHNEKSVINGTLNSIKGHHVGGNVFLVNPNGVVVGESGVINVGKLTTITPTKDFTDHFFDGNKNPNPDSVNALMGGTAPINHEGIIEINGKNIPYRK